MGFLDRFTSKVSKEITALTFPDEFKLYLYYVQYNLEGFDFKDHITNKAIEILKDEYAYYQNCKDSNDFKSATSKYDDNTYLKDLINNRNHYDRAEALAYLLMYDIIFYYKYDFYGKAFTIFKSHVVEVIKSLDREKIPESFFCHHRADEFLQKEQEKQEDHTKKYLDLYDAYTKVCLKLSEYEDDEDY